MADEQNLNGLAGGGSSGAQNAVKATARTLVNDYWNKAQAAAANIRRDLAAAERSAKAIGSSVGRVDLSQWDNPTRAGGTGGMGLGGGSSIMPRATFSTNSAGVTQRLSTNTSLEPRFSGQLDSRAAAGQVMPYGNQPSGYNGPQLSGQRALPGGFAGWRTAMEPRFSGGAMQPYGGGGGGIVPMGGATFSTPPAGGGGNGNGTGNRISNGAVIAGGLAAYGASQQNTVYGRDFVGQQMAGQYGGRAQDYYSGSYATILGQSSTSDMLQARGTLNRMGALPGSSDYKFMQNQVSSLAMQTGLGASGSANVYQSLRSANTANRSRALLGLPTMGPSGQPADVNKYAKQVMDRLWHGKTAPTRADVQAAIAPGRAIDYALNQLGLDQDTQNTIESSMLAQAGGGGAKDLKALNMGRANTSKAKSIARGSDIEGDKENGAVIASETMNKAAETFKGAVDDFLKATHLGGALGFGSSGLNLAGHVGVDLLAGKAIKTVGKKAFSLGAKRVATAGATATASEGAELAGGAALGLGGAALGVAGAVALGGGALIYFGGDTSTMDDYKRRVKKAEHGKHGSTRGNWTNKHSNAPALFNPDGSMNPAAFNGSDGAGASRVDGGGSNGPTGAGGAVAIAMKYLGTPYVWGGNEPGGFDCSGLVQLVFKQLGVNLPRTSGEQSKCGTAVASLAQAMPGDLLFWNPGHVHHVAIYIGGGKMIAAPHTGTDVRIQSVYSGYFIRRVLGNGNAISGKNTNTLAAGMGTTNGGSMDSSSGGSQATLAGGSALSTSSTGISGNLSSAGSIIASALAGGGGGGGAGIGGNTGMGSAASALGSGGGSSGSTASAPANVSGNAALVKRLAKAYGWDTGSEWNSLYATVAEESGFNSNNQNKTSTAYGLFQFLDSTWGDYGYKKTSDPTIQTEAGLKYIKARYGDPNKEWAFHKAHNWYQKGSFEIGHDQDARLHAGEMVVPKEQADKVRAASRGGGGGGGNVTIQIYAQTIDDAAISKVVAAVKKANQVDSMTAALVMGT